MDYRKLCHHLLLCCFAISLTCCGIVAELHAQVSEQWLVLKNSQTIQGTVTFAAQRYTVTTSSGSRIIVAEDQVSFVAESIGDVYWDKWSRVDPQSPRSHIKLFRWCLKNDLLAEAQKQIDLVAKTDGIADQSGHLSRMAEELELVVQRKHEQLQLANQQEIEQLEIRN